MPELSFVGDFRHSLFMKNELAHVIESIQASGFKAAFVVTGGGVGAVHEILSHPGASRLVQEVQIPYSPEALFDYLGERLEQTCSAEAAATMAERAFERALIFSLSSKVSYPILGVSCTAALQTNRERKGPDRAFIYFKTRKKEVTHNLDLCPGTRAEQDQQLSAELLELLVAFLSEQNE